MADIAVNPNWASPPGETILAVLHAKGVNLDVFRIEVGLDKTQTSELFAGVLPITPLIAKSLAKSLGSTPRFWMERQRQYGETLKQLAAVKPELTEWGAQFPLKKMFESGWLHRPHAKSDEVFELLDYFDIETLDEWREKYPARLGLTKFRTSETLQNDLPTTLAWIRRGELLAEEIECAAWNRTAFQSSLPALKPLSRITSPEDFLPILQNHCARYGVAVVVARSIPGCAASGATLMLSKKKALLLVSARFLSDDQFWFSFFHEAGHLVLHENEAHIEQHEASTPQQEAEANLFAETLILEPAGKDVLRDMTISPLSIARLARQCNISKGLVVGQLQNLGRISPKLFTKFKIRYRSSSFTL
jgi:Zn-dependent peptidase ImmA (M78 family)/plasmid maintenance system antidote protein VapI